MAQAGKLVRFALGLVALFEPLAASSKAGAEQCVLQRITALDMQTSEDGTFSVPVMIGGRSMPLLVDTGSVQTAITEEASSELGLRLGPNYNGGTFLNNVAAIGTSKLPSLGLGPMKSDGQWSVIVVPNRLLPLTMFGLLGPDVLENYDIEFDFLSGKLGVFVPHKCAGRAVYWTADAYAALPMIKKETGHIVVNATLDGKGVTVIFDTGSASSSMSLDVARELFGWANDDPRIKSTGIENINGGQAASTFTFPFDALNFDGIELVHPKIQLIPAKNFINIRHEDAPIVLGMSVLRQMHIYVAYQEGVVYLTGARASALPDMSQSK